jgi:hypothetical protein
MINTPYPPALVSIGIVDLPFKNYFGKKKA